MQGSLALHEGVLWVGRHAKTAHVRPVDLDGRPLAGGFTFRDPRFPRAAVRGLCVDADHRIWVADTPASKLRAFTLFGGEIKAIGGELHGTDAAKHDATEPLTEPVDVDLLRPPGATEDEGESLLVVASRGRRRHALRVFEADGRFVESLRPLGDPQDRFAGIEGIATGGRRLYVCEGLAGRVQVFRDWDFHFAFRPSDGAQELRPVGAACFDGDRTVIACAGGFDGSDGSDGGSRLLLCDPAGRCERVLAAHGEAEGSVFEPSDVVVQPAELDRRARVFVLDRDGERIQVFNLEGRCYGAFDGSALERRRPDR